MARKLPQGNKKVSQKFKPEEAIVAIGLVTIAADGTVEEVESQTLMDVLQESEVFNEYSEEEFNALINKIVKLGQKEGIEALLNSAVEALPEKDQKEAALMVAFLIVSADGEVIEEEEEYLHALQGMLGVPDKVYDRILKEMFGE
jgi:tellurite resistance protein